MNLRTSFNWLAQLLSLVLVVNLLACGDGSGGTVTPSTNANLSALSLSEGELTPSFGSATLSYQVSVDNSVSSLMVLPSAEQSSATINVDGSSVSSGANSQAIDLIVGNTTINITVTAEDGTTQRVYSVLVSRPAPLGNNANLSTLTLSTGELSPLFDSETLTYEVTVDGSVSSIMMLPSAAQSTATIDVNGSPVSSGSNSQAIDLIVGDTSIDITVTAEDGTTQRIYSVLVTRTIPLGTNADLADLSISAGTLTPSFSSTVLAYSVNVEFDTAAINVIPTLFDENAIVTVNGSAVTSGEASSEISLIVGVNDIQIQVTSEDTNSVVNYTVTFNRAEALSNIVNLIGLEISEGELSPQFGGATLSYTASVAFNIESVSVTPTTQDSNATVTVNGASVVSGNASAPIVLTEGENTIAILVVAESGLDDQYYQIVVTRESLVEFAQQAYIKASNTGVNDRFGSAISASGNTLVVGAPYESGGTTGIDGDQTNDDAETAGAAYVFVKDAEGVWSQQAYLKASNTDAGDRFGISVAIDGDTIVIGADQESSNAEGIDGDQTDNSTIYAGAIYVFVRSGNSWSQQAYIKPSFTFSYAYFGASVDVDGDLLVVGAINRERVTLFSRNAGVWTQQADVYPVSGDSNDRFGASVDLDGDTLAVGAYQEDGSSTGVNGVANNDATNAGAVYVFTYLNNFWQQQAYIKASNTDAGDTFGFDVALDGDRLAVGAIYESSDAEGINGEDNDNANRSGAVYLYSRLGTNWSQEAYVKSSNNGDNDQFGTSVSLDGDKLAVGAFFETSSATGIDGEQLDNSAFQAGAAYLFSIVQNEWAQVHYVKASNTDAGDYFGRSVAIQGNQMVVGADLEDSNSTGVNNEDNDFSSTAGAVYLYDGDIVE